MTPRTGDVVLVGRWSAIATNALIRVIRVNQYDSTPQGHIWLDGYILDPGTGLAVETRRMFLMLDHLTVLPQATPVRRRPVNAGPVVPRQRGAQRGAVRPR